MLYLYYIHSFPFVNSEKKSRPRARPPKSNAPPRTNPPEMSATCAHRAAQITALPPIYGAYYRLIAQNRKISAHFSLCDAKPKPPEKFRNFQI